MAPSTATAALAEGPRRGFARQEELIPELEECRECLLIIIIALGPKQTIPLFFIFTFQPRHEPLAKKNDVISKGKILRTS